MRRLLTEQMLWSLEKQVYIHFHFDIQLCFSSYFRSRPIVKNLMRNFFLVENGFKNSTKIPEEGKSIIKKLMHNFYPQKQIVSKRQPKVRKVGCVTSKPYRSLYFRKSAILISRQTLFNSCLCKRSSTFVQQTLFVKLIFQFQI